MKQKKTVLLVDDHPLFQDGLKQALENEGNYSIVAKAGTAEAGLKAAAKYEPDLALVDMTLPDKSGLDLVRQLRQNHPRMRIAIVTMHSRHEYALKAFQTGVDGYFVKDASVKELLEGIRKVLKGQYYVDPSISQKIFKNMAEKGAQLSHHAPYSNSPLTPREKEVMILIAEGLPMAEISEKLFISPKTVENHRYNIMQKLGLKNIAELVRYAIQAGMVDLALKQ